MNEEKKLSEDELDNVTGGCGDKEVGSNDQACSNYKHYYGWQHPPKEHKTCSHCEYCYVEYDSDKGYIYYCCYD